MEIRTDEEALEIYAKNSLGENWRSHLQYTEMKDDFLAGCKHRQQQTELLLNDIDFLLAHFEDFTHGKDGKDLTEIRYRIQNFLK